MRFVRLLSATALAGLLSTGLGAGQQSVTTLPTDPHDPRLNQGQKQEAVGDTVMVSTQLPIVTARSRSSRASRRRYARGWRPGASASRILARIAGTPARCRSSGVIPHLGRVPASRTPAGANAAARTIQVMIGLVLAACANIVPKDIGPWRASAGAAAGAQSVQRVGGWSLTLAGLGYAALWAFTPIAFAAVAGMVIVAAATLATAAYSVVICRRQQAG